MRSKRRLPPSVVTDSLYVIASNLYRPDEIGVMHGCAIDVGVYASVLLVLLFVYMSALNPGSLINNASETEIKVAKETGCLVP